jgi:hypothetical protein
VFPIFEGASTIGSIKNCAAPSAVNGSRIPYSTTWCFIGIERHSKLVLCFELGKRTETSAGRFMAKLASATHPSKRFQLTTDGLPALLAVTWATAWTTRNLSRSTRRRRKGNAATARPKWLAQNQSPSRETQTCNGSARPISSARTGAFASGANGLRGSRTRSVRNGRICARHWRSTSRTTTSAGFTVRSRRRPLWLWGLPLPDGRWRICWRKSFRYSIPLTFSFESWHTGSVPRREGLFPPHSVKWSDLTEAETKKGNASMLPYISDIRILHYFSQGSL